MLKIWVILMNATNITKAWTKKTNKMGRFGVWQYYQSIFFNEFRMVNGVMRNSADETIRSRGGRLNNILRLNLRKKLALHCNNVYFCPQFEVDTYGNLRMTSVSDRCPPRREAKGESRVSFLGDCRGAANFVVLQNESK